MCEEQAQGNGATTVRVMRQRTRARREAGIPATKYRAADAGCSAREESRFSPKGATNTCDVSPVPEGALRGHGRGRQPSGTLLGEADCTGLDPEAVYVYGERVEGRARCPPQRASTVAPTVTARCQANQHSAVRGNNYAALRFAKRPLESAAPTMRRTSPGTRKIW